MYLKGLIDKRLSIATCIMVVILSIVIAIVFQEEEMLVISLIGIVSFVGLVVLTLQWLDIID